MRSGFKTLLMLAIVLCVHQSLLAQGQLFGTTRSGGSTGGGVLFKTNADSSTYMEVVKEWVLDVAGSSPHASLIKASNGKLYGTTPSGGKYDQGVIFEYGAVRSSLPSCMSLELIWREYHRAVILN